MAMKRGFTLVEVMVASALSLVVAMTAFAFFRLVHQMTVSTTNSYLISRDLETGTRRLLADLRGTALSSLRAYPGPQGVGAPGLCMVSADDEQDHTVLGESGSPVWQRWILYSLDVKPGQKNGSLVRWEVPRTNRLPDIGPIPRLPGNASAHVLITNVAAPNLDEAAGSERFRTGPAGGFLLEFVRVPTSGGAYETSPYNPAQATQGQGGLDFRGNTKLVQLRLSLFETSSTGKPTCLELMLRVSPRY